MLSFTTPASARLVRAKDGSESVLLSLAEFQALLDAASATGAHRGNRPWDDLKDPRAGYVESGDDFR